MTREGNKNQVNFSNGPDRSSSVSPAALDEKTMRLILRQMPIDFWARNATDRRVVFQSDLSIETWGNLRGTTSDESKVPPELITEWNEGISGALEGNTIHHEGVLSLSSDEKLTIRRTFGPILDKAGQTMGVLGICADITEQKEKEHLLISRRKLAEQLNKTSDCTEALEYCFETALRVSRVNTANLFSVDEELVGTLLFQQGNSPEFVEKFSTLTMDEPLKEAAAQGKTLIRTPDQFPAEIFVLLSSRHIGEIAHFLIKHDGQVVAVLNVASCNHKKFPQWCIDELETITSQTEATLGRIRTQEKLKADRRLLRQLLQMQEQERQLLSSEIHDDFVQDIVGAQMVLEAAKQTCGRHNPTCDELFGQASATLGRAIKEARRLISDLRPLVIEESGIVEAIHFLINRVKASSPMKISYTHDRAIDRFDPIIEGVAFRIVQEGITNAIRHSQGTKIKVSVTENHELLTIKVVDDGIGFDPNQVSENRFGIRGITERASLFGGTAKIKSPPEKGTTIIVKLPINRTSNTTSY